MSKKLYSVGFEKTKLFIEKNKKLFRENINDNNKLHFYSTFGKSYYELEIFDFFKKHSIQKDTSYSMKLFNHFKSNEFILQTLKYSGLLDILTDEEKSNENNKEFLISYFYNCCYLLNEKIKNDKAEETFFYLNFLHHSSSFSSSNNININHEAIIKNILKPEFPKESFGEINNEAFFKLIYKNEVIISLNGTSIKTLRKKAYKQFLFAYLDEIQIWNYLIKKIRYIY